jgi:hypothetical protein
MRNQIAQTMMNIGNPPPQAGGSLPPGMMMAPTPLKSLMGVTPGMSPGFMGGEPAPMPGAAPQQQQQQPVQSAEPMPQTQAASPATANPSFAASPAVPGQTPSMFAKPPTF